MPNTRTDGQLRGLAFVGLIGILFSACEPDVPVPDPVSNCRVKKNLIFHINAMQFDHYHPQKCPHLLGNDPLWGFTEYYQGTESAPSAYVAPGAIVFTTIENDAGDPVGGTDGTMVLWGSTVRTDLSGLFSRASVPTDCISCIGQDVAYNMVLGRDNQLATADVQMPYYRRMTVGIGGPNWCPPGPGYQCPSFPSSFTLTADVTNAFNGPYLYEWFRDGVSLGPASQASTLTDYGYTEGTMQRYEVAVTDTLRGRVMSPVKEVWVPYSEQGSGCDPYVIQCPE